ncbi:MAG: SDR family oxidoreductase [Gammaproteobacteria bacterium]
MTDKILVIGATGNVGAQIVRQLAAQGFPVKAAVYPPELTEYRAAPNVEAVPFDFYRSETFAAALAGVHRLYLMCKDDDPEPDRVLNPFVDQAKNAGVEHIVLMTGIHVDKAPDSVGYRRVEKYVMASGLAYTILRPTWFMQFFQTPFILATIRRHGGIFLPADDGRVSFIAASDIAAVAATVLTRNGHEGKEYTLTGGEALSFADVAGILSRAIGHAIRYVNGSLDEVRRVVAEVGGWQGPIEFMDYLFRTVRDGEVEQIYPTVREITGRDPITFARFARDNAAFWQ